MEFEDELIEMVRSNPILYKLKGINFAKDVTKKDNCWREIGQKLNRSPLECKAKWRNIRDSYRRYQNRKRSGSAVSSKYDDRRLKFIDELDSNNEETTDETPLLKINIKKPMKKFKRVNKEKKIHRVNTVSKVTENPLLPRVDNTPVHSFFNSMADIVSTFPADKIAQIRQKICNVVTEMELSILSNLRNDETSTSTQKGVTCLPSTTAVYLSPKSASSSSDSPSPIIYKQENEDSD